MPASAARAPRGGRERRAGLRKPVVVRRDSRPADRHSGGLLDGPIGFPKARPSLPPGERAVRVRTETLPGPDPTCGRGRDWEYTPVVKVLVIEDELDVGAVFRDFLLELGHEA